MQSVTQLVPQSSRKRRDKLYKAPAKRSQHAAQRNISQHWAQHVCVWPPCCDMLGVVLLEPTTPNMSQHIETRWPNAHMLRPVLRYVAIVRPGLKTLALATQRVTGKRLQNKSLQRLQRAELSSNFLQPL